MLTAIKNKLRPWYHRLTRPPAYHVEKALLAGKHRTSSQQPSVLHFSLNKAATQYVKTLLNYIASHNTLTPVGMNEWAFGSTQPYLDHLSKAEMQAYKHVFKPKGYLYSVFGGFVEGIDNLEDYRIILMVRDPRDILVSGFYSMAYSHPLPGENSGKREGFLAKRKKALEIGIDAYVLQEAPRLQANLLRYYEKLLLPFPQTHLLRYEDMISDFPSFLDMLTAASGCTLTAADRDILIAKHRAEQPITEDIKKHTRKGVSGDYREKLKPETIADLHRILHAVAGYFGYHTNPDVQE
jgi:hypothetical protein